MARERALWFSVPVYTMLAAVLLWPMAQTAYLSLFSYQLLSGRRIFAGLANYGAVLADEQFVLATRNTLVYSAASVSLELLLGLFMATLLNRRGRLMSAVRAAVIAPWVLSPVVAGLMWRMIFHSNYGVLNYLLSRVGVPIGSVEWLGTPALAMAAVIIVEIWQNTPFVFIVLYAGLQALPPEPIEAAVVDGASPWQIFRYVTLPQLGPAIAVAGTFRLIFTLREFTIPWTLTGGGPSNATLLLSIYLYRQMLQFFELGKAAAVGWLMFVLTAVLATIFVIRVLRPTWEGV